MDRRETHAGRALAAVIVPAYNEEAVIGRCLDSLLRDKPEDVDIELVIACNGCEDDTAGIARAHAPNAHVLELAQPSKPKALNAADESCTAFPRIYVDADIEMSFGSLSQLVEALSADQVLCAAPTVQFVVDERPWAVRRFYDAFQRLPYVTEGMVGTGVYALSERGHARLGSFPDVVADDEYVRSLFAFDERRSISTAMFRVHTPRTLADLIRVRQRIYRGNRELAQLRPSRARPTNTLRSTMRLAASRPTSVATLLVVNMIARLRARVAGGTGVSWERDLSTR